MPIYHLQIHTHSIHTGLLTNTKYIDCLPKQYHLTSNLFTHGLYGTVWYTGHHMVIMILTDRGHSLQVYLQPKP